MNTAPSQKWEYQTIFNLFQQPFNDLIYQAHTVFKEHFDANKMQLSTLLNIKTGRCPEDCAYCPQSGHYQTNLKKEPLMDPSLVLEAATAAKAAGATRFCMGAAWRSPRDTELEAVSHLIREVKALGLETCATLGMLKPHQAEKLKEAGLDFYNHNIDTSEAYYEKIITTRTFQDRLNTLENVRKSGIKVCCGGILGMGETTEDRLKMLQVLANLDAPPESVPINQLIPIPGTPLGDAPPTDPFDFVRIIAVARILMPTSYVRLSAGRESMPEALQALCFFAGVNSIFYGEKLLTAANPAPTKDDHLLHRLGIQKIVLSEPCTTAAV